MTDLDPAETFLAGWKACSHFLEGPSAAGYPTTSEEAWELYVADEESRAQPPRGQQPPSGEATLRRCLGFFASVIKSGEPWTETCEREYREALAHPSPNVWRDIASAPVVRLVMDAMVRSRNMDQSDLEAFDFTAHKTVDAILSLSSEPRANPATEEGEHVPIQLERVEAKEVGDHDGFYETEVPHPHRTP